MSRLTRLFALFATALIFGCAQAPEPAAELDREAFNLAAQRLDLPLLWVADHDGDKRPDIDELAGLAFFDQAPNWLENGELTEDFAMAVEAIELEIEGKTLPSAPAEDALRRRLVAEDLDQARPSLVSANLSGLEAWERTMLDHFWAAGSLIDQLHAEQLGITDLESQLPADHPASRRLFRRNNGPACVAPRTQTNPACSALVELTFPTVDPYPAALQANTEFCATMEEQADLAAPFTVVREMDGELQAIPYSEAYADLMASIATELRSAAELIPEGQEEALATYLREAATAFENNDWPTADESWAAMNAHNSKWYLRIAPDETYWEPCSLKAGFHFTLARIDPSSISWQEKLAPLRSDMESEIAELSGAPYAARDVKFDLPDFLEIIANFGDDRSPIGGTAGQSLPNWGAVANEGRGRTVVMTNLGTDPDSRQIRRRQLSSIIDAETLQQLSPESPKPSSELLNTILHEASHNLGPAHEYEVEGRIDSEIFGGSLATIFEELKAQTFGLWLIEFLQEREVISAEDAREAYGAVFAWSMRHISRGMETSGGSPRAYSQLAAIQIGYLIDSGAVAFDSNAKAANGEDIGAFHIEFDALPAAWKALAEEVGGIKATGNAEAASTLRDRYVKGSIVPFEIIDERTLRHPEPTFVYTPER